MGLPKAIERYRNRAKIVLAGRRLHARTPEPPPAPFVCGVTRSGTTLLRLMLDSHPEVAIPGETHWLPKLIKAFERSKQTPNDAAALIIDHKRWGDFHLDGAELQRRIRALDPVTAADAIRMFYMLYAEREGKHRYGDKTPGYVKEMRRIQRVLPEARFVHIIRDGRDVSLSHLRMNWGPETYAESARLWRNRIRKARKMAPSIDHYMEVHFEDLVDDTEGVVRRVCDFIDLHFDPVMLSYHERAEGRLAEKARELPRKNRPPQPAEARLESHRLAKEPPRMDRIGMWRERMTPEEVAEYEAVAGDMLVQLGYELASEAGEARAAEKGVVAPVGARG
ncbi:MAG TPA: sulfotransferase [Solirubrobacterales bacterium]|nr:sulfotransferase [Solirubrobacterales bacterium]